MIFWLQSLVSGLLMGGVYALVSEGLTLTYGTMKLINFAHGSFLMLAMYFSYWLFTLAGIDPYISLPLSFVTFFVFGWTISKTFIIKALNAPVMIQFLITFGLAIIFENSALMLWSADQRIVITDYSLYSLNIYDLFIVFFPKLFAFIISGIIALLGYFFLQKTWTGLAIRAVAQNKQTAKIFGVDTDKIYSFTFGLGIGFVGVAGTLLSVFFPTQPYVGSSFIIIAFVVTVLGGLGNYLGAFIGGLIIGIIENMSVYLIAPQFKQVAYLTIFLLVILFRPKGILGKSVGR